jgi:translation initiation factor eIF-2B subunit delta
LFEGVALAERLRRAGAAVTVITDAQAALFAARSDAVLVGADAVNDGGVVNKVGTHAAALAARAAGVPVYAVADTFKLSPGRVAAVAAGGLRDADEEEEKATGEVAAAWRGALGIAGDDLPTRNVYFESTPLALFAGIVTERGVLSGPEAAAILQAQRKAYISAFRLEPLEAA